MVYILKPNDNAEEILDKVKEFLAERGMEISEQKTKITATTDGFNFLGWNFKVQKNGKFRSRPSEDNYKAFRKKVKAIINCSNYGAMDKKRVLTRQHHSCATCGQKLTSEERVHLHHVDGNHKNNRWQNLAAMHESCHDYLHMSKSKD